MNVKYVFWLENRRTSKKEFTLSQVPVLLGFLLGQVYYCCFQDLGVRICTSSIFKCRVLPAFSKPKSGEATKLPLLFFFIVEDLCFARRQAGCPPGIKQAGCSSECLSLGLQWNEAHFVLANIYIQYTRSTARESSVGWTYVSFSLIYLLFCDPITSDELSVLYLNNQSKGKIPIYRLD